MLSQFLGFASLATLAMSAPTASSSAATSTATLSVADCAASSSGRICTPTNDSPTSPIGDHIGVNFVATGVHNSTGIASALRDKKTGKITPLTWNQRAPDGTENGEDYFYILTSHQGGIFYGDVGPAFAGEGQFPCSLFNDNPGGEAEFEWLLTHFYGPACRYNETIFCVPDPFLINVPPHEGPKEILLKDNAEVCGR